MVCKVEWSDKKLYTSQVLAIGTKADLKEIQELRAQTGEGETNAEQDGKRTDKKTNAKTNDTHPPPKVCHPVLVLKAVELR